VTRTLERRDAPWVSAIDTHLREARPLAVGALGARFAARAPTYTDYITYTSGGGMPLITTSVLVGVRQPNS